MTGIYQRPVQAALRRAAFDTRTVHPFASKHYRKPLYPDIKTDDNDLEAIFYGAINGYGTAISPVDDTYKSLLALTRHRRNLLLPLLILNTDLINGEILRVANLRPAKFSAEVVLSIPRTIVLLTPKQASASAIVIT